MATNETAQEWLDEGDKKFNNNDWNGAIVSYTGAYKAIGLEPRAARAYNNRGLAWYEKGEYDKALENYNKAIELNPNYAKAYNNCGLVWDEKEEYDKAIENYNKAIELDPNYIDAYNNRGNAWYEGGEYDKALADCDKTIELDPKYSNAYYNRGLLWDEKEEYDKALEDYNKAIELNPNHANAYNNRGSVWGHKKEYDRAIKDFNKSLEIDPDLKPAIHNRGIALAQQAAQGLQEQFKVDVDDLKRRAEEEKKKAEKTQKHFNSLLIAFGVICAIFTIFIMTKVFPYTAGLLSFFSSNIYFPIAEASAFGIISFPFIWALKQLKATEARHRILSETFESLAFIEPRISFFGGQDLDWQKKMYELYITYRIKEGPEKLLLDLYQQKSDRPPATTPAAVVEKAINGKKD